MHLSQVLPQMVLAIESILPSASAPAARAIVFHCRREMDLLVTVEIVLALCLVFAAGVKAAEGAWFGGGVGARVGGGSLFVAALGGGVDGSGVGEVYHRGIGVGCARRDGLGVVYLIGGGGIGVGRIA